MFINTFERLITSPYKRRWFVDMLGFQHKQHWTILNNIILFVMHTFLFHARRAPAKNHFPTTIPAITDAKTVKRKEKLLPGTFSSYQDLKMPLTIPVMYIKWLWVVWGASLSENGIKICPNFLVLTEVL